MTTRHTYNVFLLGLMAAIMCMQGLVGNTDTISYFNDIETSHNNYLRADPIDFSVNLEGLRDAALGVGDTASFTAVMKLEAGSHPTEYRVKALQVGGDAAFCAGLQVYTTDPLIYSGGLTGLEVDGAQEPGPWTLNVSLQDGTYDPTAYCEIKLLYTGWEVGLQEGEGYIDEEEVSLHITYNYVAPAVAASVEAVVETPAPEQPTDEVTPEATEETISEPVPEPASPPEPQSETETLVE